MQKGRTGISRGSMRLWGEKSLTPASGGAEYKKAAEDTLQPLLRLKRGGVLTRVREPKKHASHFRGDFRLAYWKKGKSSRLQKANNLLNARDDDKTDSIKLPHELQKRERHFQERRIGLCIFFKGARGQQRGRNRTWSLTI